MTTRKGFLLDAFKYFKIDNLNHLEAVIYLETQLPEAVYSKFASLYSPPIDETPSKPVPPKNVNKINPAGLAILKESEGLRLHAYLCPANVLTIGYGSVGPHVKPGMKITEIQAEELLLKDLDRFEKGVAELVKVPINENQFSALVCFAFNVGLDALKNSTLLRLLNAGDDMFNVAAQFKRWTKANGTILPGLVLRREKERILFLTPVD